MIEESTFNYKFRKSKGVIYHESQMMLDRLKTMLKLISRGDQLLEKYEQIHNIKYDLVVRLQPDLRIMTPLKLDQLDWKTNQLYVYRHYLKFPMADYLMVGSREIMREVLNFSEEMESFSEQSGENYSRLEFSWVNFFRTKKIKWTTFRGKVYSQDFELVKR